MGGELVLRIAADRGREVDPSSAAAIRAAVSSRYLGETMLGNSYHVATLDHDAPILFEESTLFIRRVTGP